MHLFYLHGFASSAQSSKASFFRAKLAACGLTLHTPDFNLPDFSTLTISRMVDQVRMAIDEVGPGPVTLIGSSLGAFVAVHSAVQNRDRVVRLILLAPALDFDGNRLRELGDRGVDEWRSTDRLDVFHYAYGRVMPVGYALYTDAQKYDAIHAAIDIPVLIFQGRRDASVDPVTVERWALARPNVDLRLLDDDHQLLGSLDYIWKESARFLGLTPAPSLPQDGAPQA